MAKKTRNWQLPPGVSRGTWDYLQSESIATDYDGYFRDSPMMGFDLEFVSRHLPSAGGVVADFGCGTGRVAEALAPRGYRVVNIDLSSNMLRCVADKELPKNHSVCVAANLVELDCLGDETLDLGLCLFSSLGMIRRRHNRIQFLAHVRRCLRPGAALIVHVHNRYHSLFDPGGSWWLLRSWLRSVLGSSEEFGDRIYSYRGLPRMYLHNFSRREISQDLRAAGFRRCSIEYLDQTGGKTLSYTKWFSALRAGGFLVLAAA